MQGPPKDPREMRSQRKPRAEGRGRSFGPTITDTQLNFSIRKTRRGRRNPETIKNNKLRRKEKRKLNRKIIRTHKASKKGTEEGQSSVLNEIVLDNSRAEKIPSNNSPILSVSDRLPPLP